MDIAACTQATITLPAVLFCFGAIISAILMVTRFGLTAMQALAVLMGLRRIDLPLPLKVLGFATLIMPLILWVVLVQRCAS